MLPLPFKFDQNEWFVIITCVVGYLWLLFVPKRYPHVISILIMLFTVTIAVIMDYTIATPPLDLYDINDFKEYELTDGFTYFMYSPYALLCVYLFDKFNPKGLFFTIYFVAWSLFSLGFERLAVAFNVYKFHGWTFLYSFSFYLIATPLLLKYFQYLLRSFYDKHNQTM
jgi:hypothetical protein